MSSTRLLILGAIRIMQPVHGYDVRRELLSWRADVWGNVAPGSIYNQLRTLQRDGLIRRVGTEQEGARPERTVYEITAEGEKEFKLLDTQFTTEHLKTFGAIDVPKEEYAVMLDAAMDSPHLQF